jgi:hypothetical protein
MITVVLIGLDAKEHARGLMDEKVIENSTIICRNGRYFTFVRANDGGNLAMYKERLAPYIIREF